MAVSKSMTFSNDGCEKQTPRTHSFSGFVKIALAFSTVFFPLVLVATLLCLYVTIPIWTIHNPPEENADLPILPLDDSAFYTAIMQKKVVLTSSWASNIGSMAAAPFLLLFSFLVALELADQHQGTDQDVTTLLRGSISWWSSWAIIRSWRARNTQRAYGTRLACIGALLSLILTYVLRVNMYVHVTVC